VIYIYYHEPLIDEYGFADFGVGENGIPTELMFGEYSVISDIEPGGDVEPRYWKEVGDGYWISNLGDLYSEKSKKILTPKHLDKQGHLGYALYHDKKHIKYAYQHRLMAENFIPKGDPSYNVVRHLDGDPAYNDPHNLAWGTQKENWEDSVQHGTAYTPTDEDREIGSKKTRKPTRAINVYTGETLEFQSLNDACRYLGVQQANACKTIAGDRNQTCGWRFEYL
jgi:hypothetical protein